MDGFMTTSGIFLCGLTLIFFGMSALGSYILYLGWSYKDVQCSTSIALWAQVHGGTVLAIGVVGFILVIVSIVLLLKSTYGTVESTGWRGWLWTSGLCVPICLLGVGIVAAMLPMLIWGTVLIFGDDMWAKMKAASAGGQPPCDPRLYWPAAIYNIAMWVGGYGLLLVMACVGLCFLICCFTCCDSRRTGGGANGKGGARGGATVRGKAAFMGRGAVRRRATGSPSDEQRPSVPWDVQEQEGQGGAVGGGAGSSGSGYMRVGTSEDSTAVDVGTGAGSGTELTSKADRDRDSVGGGGGGQLRTKSGIAAPNDAKEWSILKDEVA